MAPRALQRETSRLARWEKIRSVDGWWAAFKRKTLFPPHILDSLSSSPSFLVVFLPAHRTAPRQATAAPIRSPFSGCLFNFTHPRALPQLFASFDRQSCLLSWPDVSSSPPPWYLICYTINLGPPPPDDGIPHYDRRSCLCEIPYHGPSAIVAKVDTVLSLSANTSLTANRQSTVDLPPAGPRRTPRSQHPRYLQTPARDSVTLTSHGVSVAVCLPNPEDHRHL